jgi:hypothetical protein
MSSTTDKAKGQALAVFAVSLTAVLLAAAFAFDGGLLYMQRRDQQNAADAAAIAGARYLVDSTATARQNARDAATDLAQANGFRTGQDGSVVTVHVPPATGPHAGQNGYIEVEISNSRPSFFAALMNVLSWDVSARAVALNDDSTGGGYSILALRDEGNPCTTLAIGGNGQMVAAGDIQVNMPCDGSSGAMAVGGGGEVTVELDVGGTGNCNVVGNFVPDLGDPGYDDAVNCNVVEDVTPIADPFAIPGFPVPSVGATPLALAPLRIDGDDVEPPGGCPGVSGGATVSDPQLCSFGSKHDDTVWYLYPGVYPGGLKLDGGTFYLGPGLFYLGGGGLDVGGGAVLKSVATVPAPGSDPDPSGGVLIYNSQLPGTGPKGAAGDVILNGNAADIFLLPYEDDPWGGIVLWQDKAVTKDVTINGNDSLMQVAGTIYVPTGLVKVNGSSPEGYSPPAACPTEDQLAKLQMDQIIAYEFQVTGAQCSIIEALNRDEYIYKVRGAGLVE